MGFWDHSLNAQPIRMRGVCAVLLFQGATRHASREKSLRKGTEMLKVGDRVYIDGTKEEGTVREVHPHEILVRVQVSGGHEDRKYAHEDLRRDSTMDEVSKFIDH
jgi:hypothetical protein